MSGLRLAGRRRGRVRAWGGVLALLPGGGGAKLLTILTIAVILTMVSLALVWARNLFPPDGFRNAEQERDATRLIIEATIGLISGIAVQFVAADFVAFGSSLPVLLGRIAFTVGAAVLGAIVVVRGCPARPESAPLCRKCGYNLTGLAERRCPECGEPFRTVSAWER